jgi:hypothetical protein
MVEFLQVVVGVETWLTQALVIFYRSLVWGRGFVVARVCV